MKPNILFVDGPPAVGKDYFITNFAGEYARCYPFDGILIIKASDFILDHTSNTRHLKYSPHPTTAAELDYILKSHIQLLNHIRTVSQIGRGTSLIIVNRSFLSCILHNLSDQPQHVQDEYIRKYHQAFHNLLEGHRTHHITLTPTQYDPACTEAIRRINNRQESYDIHQDWVTTIHERYDQTPEQDFASLFNIYSIATSSDSKQVMRHFLPHGT